MTRIGVVLFDGERQVFAGKKLLFRDTAMVALPVVRDKNPAFCADLLQELFERGISTWTGFPGDISP